VANLDLITRYQLRGTNASDEAVGGYYKNRRSLCAFARHRRLP